MVAFWCAMLGIASVFLTCDLNPPQKWVVWYLCILAAAYLIVLHEQMSHQPWLVAQNSVWERASPHLDGRASPVGAAVRDQAVIALGPPLAAFLSFLIGLQIGTDREATRTLVKVVAGAGVLYALYGIGQFVIDPTKVLWREKPAYVTVLTATFINRNAAGMFFGLCSFLWLAMLLDELKSRINLAKLDLDALKDLMIRSAVPRTTLGPALGFFVCLAALLMTGSRAAVLLSAAVISLMIIMTVSRGSSKRWAGLSVVLAIAGVLLFLQLFGGRVGERFDIQGFADEGRFETYKAALRLIWNSPWIGSGFGSFPYVFPEYRSGANSWGTWDRAHNTPLEIAAEAGIPIAALVVSGWMLMLMWLARNVFQKSPSPLQMVFFFFSVAVSVHSLVDFPLQISGFALPALMLVSAGFSASLNRRARSRNEIAATTVN